MKRKKVMVVLMCAAMALGTAACGSNSKSAASSAGSVVTETESTAANAGTDSIATESMVAGDEWSDYVTLADYKGQALAYADGTKIANGMTVNVDYVGKIDGTAFDGGTASDYDLTIGSGTFIDGFEDQLVGHTKGETVDVKVTFPDSYASTDLAGKDAVFTVTINKVYKTTPGEALSNIVSKSDFQKYPEQLQESWRSYWSAYVEQTAANYSMTTSDYLSQVGKTQDDINEMADSYLKTDMVSRAIVQKEGIAENDDIYKNAVKSVLANYNADSLDDLVSQGTVPQVAADYMVSYSEAEAVIEKYSVAAVADATDSSAASTES